VNFAVVVGMGLLTRIACVNTTCTWSWQCRRCGTFTRIISWWRLLLSFRTSTSCKTSSDAAELLRVAKRSACYSLYFVWKLPAGKSNLSVLCNANIWATRLLGLFCIG